MRIPISDTQKGVVRTYKYGTANNGYFIPATAEWSYDYNVKKGCRKMTYGEFKEMYPYKNFNQYSRSTTKTKHNAQYNP